MRSLLLAACVVVLAGCEGPMGFMSGGALEGEVTTPPEIWALDSDSSLAQLETRPEEPYSINLAYVQLDGRLYVYAGNTRTHWVQHIEQKPLVRIRIDESVYPMRAVRVLDATENEAFAEAWASRSVFQRDPRQFDEVWLYRLENR